MSKTVSRLPLERLTALDLLMTQSAAQKMTTRAVKWAHRFTGRFGNRGMSTEIAIPSGKAVCLGGLEVGIFNPTTIAVGAGQLLLGGQSTTTLTRPATYTFQDPVPFSTPAVPEPDNDAARIFDNAYDRTIPFTFGPVLGAGEWWMVYATISTTTTETDTNRKVYNQTTGVWDAATQAKVSKNLLTFGIVRGMSLSGFPAIPANSYTLAAIFVQSGEANLANAMVFDMRYSPEPSLEPNEVGGCWRVRETGSGATLLGNLWATHRGERLSFRTGIEMRIYDLCSPGATWDAAATGSTPKLAWIYLARASNGLVPRMKQRGAGGTGTSSDTEHNMYADGVLVFSPVPPTIGIGAAHNKTSGQWDLTNSASIPLPSYALSSPTAPLAYPFEGQSVAAGDAICVGMATYNGLSGGSKPTILAMNVTPDGWARGRSIWVASRGSIAANPIANATATYPVGQVVLEAARGVTAGGMNVPIDGVELAHAGLYNATSIIWSDGLTTGNGAATVSKISDRFTTAFASRAETTVPVEDGSYSGTVPSTNDDVAIVAVRFPYGVPLFVGLRQRVAGGGPAPNPAYGRGCCNLETGSETSGGKGGGKGGGNAGRPGISGSGIFTVLSPHGVGMTTGR